MWITPLKLEQLFGQFLFHILVNRLHRLPAAHNQKLEQLQTDHTAEMNEEPAPSRTDIVLCKRIVKVNANKRKRALEEILYTLVAQKFVEAEFPESL